MHAPSRIDRQLSPTHQFLVGLLLVPAFLLQPALPVKAGQAVLFVLLCAVSGRRFSLPASAALFAGIVLFHLLTPAGKVLWRAGPLVVTDLALREGLFRALTVTGLFYISRFSIRRDITLPGAAGRLLGRVFSYYDLLLRTASLRPGRLMETLDEGLVAASRSSRSSRGRDQGRGLPGGPDGAPESGDRSYAGAGRTTAFGWALLVGLLVLSWALLAL